VVRLAGLSLLDAMIRRTPGRRTAAASPVPANGRAPEDGSPDTTAEQPADAVVVPLSTLLHDSRTAPASRAQAAAGQAAVSQSAAGASRAQAAAIEPVVDGGQPEVTASPPQISAGPAAADAQPAVAESPAPVPQTPPTPRPPERDASGNPHAGLADSVTHFDRMRSSPTPPEG
jgi:hypothetical protein